MLEYVNIKDFKVGQRIKGVYLIKSIAVKITNSNNKKYLDITLSDKTGDINAKLWDLKEDFNNNEFVENTLVCVKGCVLSWQSIMQLKLESISNDFDRENINISDYVKCAPIDSNEMFNELHKINLDDEIIINTLNNEFTYVVKDIFEVNPEDTFVLDQDNEIKELTIVTCTNKGKDRLIVKAEIVEDKNNK